jgi:hypothetical protein
MSNWAVLAILPKKISKIGKIRFWIKNGWGRNPEGITKLTKFTEFLGRGVGRVGCDGRAREAGIVGGPSSDFISG